jgi:hypothetical protein
MANMARVTQLLLRMFANEVLRSLGSRLASRRAPNVYQTFSLHLAEQSQKILLAALWFDVVLVHQRVAQLADASRLPEQLPYARGHRVHTIIDAIFEVQNGRFVPQGAGNLF